MSFETWLETSDIPEHYLGISHVRDAFEAGHAEFEAEMQAPMKCGHPKLCWQFGHDGPAHDYSERCTLECKAGMRCIFCAQIAALQLDLTKAVRLAADYGIERDALQSERDALRELLWLNHAQYTPYVHTPYGDDGEMQCCGIDFKRWSIGEIQAHLDRRLSTPASGEPARKP